MKKKINELYSIIEKEFEVGEWTLDEMERLMSELEVLIETVSDETCEACGHRPATGACFYCKMD